MMETDEGLISLKCYSAIASIEGTSNISSSLVEKLISQVPNLEKSLYCPKDLSPTPIQHEEVVRARNAVVAAKIYSSVFKWVPEDYYSFSLSKRSQILGAQSTFQLCKSMLMENKSFDPAQADGSTYGRFYLVLLQYESTINNKKLQSEIRALRPVANRLDPSNFDFRVASEEENARLTGYSHNAVTPFGMLENVPIVLSKAIVDTEDMTQFIWMGGGHIHCKIGLSVSDFIGVMKPLVLDVTDKRS